MAETKILQKMFEIQKENLKYSKNAENPFFKSKYLTLEGIWETLAPQLEKHGLLVTHGTVDGHVVTTVHDVETGSIFQSNMPLPENLDPQKLGSAVTYYKRYNLGQIFNIIVDEDDDGNVSSGNNNNDFEL